MNLLTRNFWLKLASLVLSFLVWLYVQSQSPLMDRGVFSFQLVPRNRPSDVIITRMPDFVSIEAEGTREEIAKLKKLSSKLTATVDLSDAEPGDGEYRVERIDPPEVNVKWGRAGTVLVTLDRTVRVERLVEVESYRPPDGLEFTGANVQPETVALEGPESQVQNIQRVRVQIDLGGSAYKPGASYSAKVEVLGESKLLPLVTVTPEQVMVRPVLSPTLGRRSVLVSPVWKGQPATGFRVIGVDVNPVAVDVRGDTKALRSIETVETSPVDVSGLSQNRSFVVNLVPPRGVRVEARTVTVRVLVAPLPTPPSEPSPTSGGPGQ